MIYDLGDGILVRTASDDPSGGDHVLLEEDVDDARARIAKGQKPEAVAKRLGATVYEPPTEPDRSAQLAVDLSGLIAAVGVERASELSGVPVDILERMSEAPQI